MSERVPLVIFSHELGNDHTSGERYAERLAEAGYAAYVFDFRGGTVGGNRSDGSNREMSVLTEALAEVEWEDNDSVEALKEMCRETPLTIQMSMYGISHICCSKEYHSSGESDKTTEGE